MLLQTNSYIVPKDKRAQHARLVQRFRHTLTRLGCAHFEAYEQVGANWSPADTTGRFVQLMRFKDRKQQLAVQAAERNDATAQALIKEFCELINFPYQQQQGLFAVGFYHSLLPNQSVRTTDAAEDGDSAVDEELDSSDAPDNAVASRPASVATNRSPHQASPAVESAPVAARNGSESDAIAKDDDAVLDDSAEFDEMLADGDEDPSAEHELADDMKLAGGEGDEIELSEEPRR